MTKAVLVYDLDEEGDVSAFNATTKAEDLARAVYEFSQRLRAIEKYEEKAGCCQEAYERVHTLFYECLHDGGLDLDSFVQ